MIQFTKAEVEKIRARSGAYPKTLANLKVQVAEVFEGKIIVPESGIANWTLYYYCPDCSVSLTFDRNRPKAHTCPCCGKVCTGEPYDSSWWGVMNAKNYNAVFSMAVIWLATGQMEYAKKAIAIMVRYAQCYPNYEVHGDIPYNGPGRSGAQTLDEANFQRTFAMAYDILSDVMTQEERELVRDQMLIPGAQFLLAHRHRQIHNHEVIIASAIAVIGILFGREQDVEAALYERYGLYDQLERGMLSDAVWFEGAFGYHFYALTSFFAFEKFALHTKYRNIHHPNYRAMMEVLVHYLEPDFSVPLLNDTNYGHLGHMKELYEFPYRELGGKPMAFVLHTAYNKKERDNLEAFLYGADEIEEAVCELETYHTPIGEPGHTILRGNDGRYLLLKHDPYGGEHDHYDRLGISFLAYGKAAARDLGTTGYGAPMHYAYYKNTASHNTMVIGEENQAPVCARLIRFEERDGGTYVEAEADWTAPYEMPDTFTIVQWSEEKYRKVKMNRKIWWFDSYFIEVFAAEEVPLGKSADWVWHVAGTLQSGAENSQPVLPGTFVSKPFSYLKDAREQTVCGKTHRLEWKCDGFSMAVFSLANGQSQITAVGPDNPSSGEISYLIERRYASGVLAAHVIECYKDAPTVQSATFSKNENRELVVTVTERTGNVRNVCVSKS